MEEVIITNEDFHGSYEGGNKLYLCSNCKDNEIRSYEQWCPSCHVKLKFDLKEDSKNA